MTKWNEPAATYAAANVVQHLRTGSDWLALHTATCPGGPARRSSWGDAITRCGQRFKVEVAGQTQCRDCHALAGTGFYAQEVE
jgi:hypothetical protein